MSLCTIFLGHPVVDSGCEKFFGAKFWSRHKVYPKPTHDDADDADGADGADDADDGENTVAAILVDK